MFPPSPATIRRTAAHIVTVAVTVVLTLVALRVIAPAATQAQPGEVRASAFVLVGPDGTVLGSLTAGPMGNGNLTLYDRAGKRRIWVAGAGNVAIWDSDDKLRVSLSYNEPVTPAGYGLAMFDAEQRPRILAGTRTGEQFGIGVLDATGMSLGSLPAPSPTPTGSSE